MDEIITGGRKEMEDETTNAELVAMLSLLVRVIKNKAKTVDDAVSIIENLIDQLGKRA